MDDGSIEESSTLIDGSTTPTKLKNARVKAINERPLPPPPDAFLTKLDDARSLYLAGDPVAATAKLTEVAVKRG